MTCFRFYLTASLLGLGLLPLLTAASDRNNEHLVRACQVVPTATQLTAAGITLPPQYDACVQLLKSNQGDPDTYFYLGRVLYLLSYVNDGLKLFKNAHDEGSTKGAVAWGYLIDKHELTPEKAGIRKMELYQRASDLGDPVAKTLLGFELGMKDEGTAEGALRAVELFEEASEQGYPVANYYLAISHHYPLHGSSRDMNLAVEYYKKAAEGGVFDAVEALSQLGEDVSQYQTGQMFYMRTDPEGMVLYRH
jgi:TPR repeat protein